MSKHLLKLFDTYWETYLFENPTHATIVGDTRYNDRLEDLSAEAIKRRRQQSADFLAQLEAMDTKTLSESDRTSHAVLSYMLHSQLRITRLLRDIPLEFASLTGTSPTPISPMHGPQIWLPLVVACTKFTKVGDYEAYLKRLAAIPVYLEQLTQQLEVGLKTGWTQPRIVLKTVPAQFSTLTNSEPSHNPLFTPFKSFPDTLSADQQHRIRQAGEKIIREHVAPAFALIKAFLETRYLPASRNEIAAAQLPDGSAYYATALQCNSMTTFTPQHIHDMGNQEVARIEAEMDAVQKRVGFADSRAAFVKYLKSDTKFFFDTQQNLLAAYHDIAKRIDPQLPTLFRELPRLPYGIKPMPEEQGDNAEYYISGAMDGSRAGYFYANANNLQHTARWQMISLLLHETVPGHHLQISRGQELNDLPMFRRNCSGAFTAYIEGWALYAETLGDLVGMYADPLDKYGHLSWDVLRAARLVVDTGMHALGWSREKAIQYMRDHTLISEGMIVAEVDRYIAWPGQATAYKLGQLHILALRDKAKAELGERFDLRAFHNAVIDNGSLPFDVLDDVIDSWITTQKTVS